MMEPDAEEAQQRAEAKRRMAERKRLIAEKKAKQQMELAAQQVEQGVERALEEAGAKAGAVLAAKAPSPPLAPSSGDGATQLTAEREGREAAVRAQELAEGLAEALLAQQVDPTGEYETAAGVNYLPT